jgi:uncharacterized protein YceH (UPF0502 family)
MYRFADLSSVEAYLQDMATRAGGALVVRLPKAAGSREHRWAHLLGGAVEFVAAEPSAAVPAAGPSLAALQTEIAALRDEVAELRLLIAEMKESKA